MSYYLSQFLSLKCAEDILNISQSLGHKPEKEISEAMAIRRILKPITLNNPNKYNVLEMCAGNALPSILAAFTLPITNTLAIDKRIRERRWDLIKKFEYLFTDINNIPHDKINNNTIIIAMHSCKNIAKTIINIYNKSLSPILILCPCCIGHIKFTENNQLQWLKEKYKISKYDQWVTYLTSLCKGTITIFNDKNILSPKNNIIIANKNIATKN